MSFSFRSMFQGTADPNQQGNATAMVGLGGQEPLPSASAMMSVSSPPLNALSPFGTPMFKIAPGEAPPAVSASPFAVMNTQDTSAPLTVGDVLPQLPPDVARAGALPAEQPVAISSQILDEALRSGRAAIPLFEIYRVCPAIFQTPISPQDPRIVPLPASKLPRLIAASKAGGTPEPMASPFSPFSSGGDGGRMEFAPGAANGSNLQLPPRRQGPPPPLADVPNRDAMPSLSLPPNGLGGAGAFPVSPFGLAGGEPQVAGIMNSMPGPSGADFQSGQQFRQQATPPSQVAQQGNSAPTFSAQPASPFSVMPAMNSNAQPSPFAAVGQSPSAIPGAGGSSPFGALFGDKAVPTGQPAPDVPPQASRPQFPSASPLQATPPQMTSPGTASSASIRISLANLIKGYTAAELGFDPMIVPAWITTALSAQAVREWSEMPTPLAQLGLVIDGITDVGFRNVLNSARRDFQIRIEGTMIQDALAGNAAPPTLPNLNNLSGLTPSSSAGFSVVAPGGAASQPGMMRVEPPSSVSPFAGSAQPASPSPFGGGTTPFGPLPQGPSPATPPGTSISGPTELGQSVDLKSAFQAFSPVANPILARPQDPFGSPAPTFGGMANSGVPPAPVPPPAPAPPPVPMSGFTIPTAFSAPAGAKPFESQDAPVNNQTPDPRLESRLHEPYMAVPYNLPPKGLAQDGFSSEQLLGKASVQETNWSKAATAAAFEPLGTSYADEKPRASQVIDLQPTSGTPFNEQSEREVAPMPPAVRAFVPPRLDEDDTLPPARPARKTEPPMQSAPPRRTPASSRSQSGSSSLGVQTHDADPDQIVLRALLDTDSDLSAQRVVELTCGLPGIAACVCLHDGQAISHIGAHKPQAREFQKQASSLAQHLRTLAPLIGIDGAETFTMNSGDRLMTFCFPEGAILGVLHDAEPTLGLRDKITLIARELSRMIA